MLNVKNTVNAKRAGAFSSPSAKFEPTDFLYKTEGCVFRSPLFVYSRILVESVSLDVTVKWFLHIGSVLGCCLYGLIGYRIDICKFNIENFVKLRETKNVY